MLAILLPALSASWNIKWHASILHWSFYCHQKSWNNNNGLKLCAFGFLVSLYFGGGSDLCRHCHGVQYQKKEFQDKAVSTNCIPYTIAWSRKSECCCTYRFLIQTVSSRSTTWTMWWLNLQRIMGPYLYQQNCTDLKLQPVAIPGASYNLDLLTSASDALHKMRDWWPGVAQESANGLGAGGALASSHVSLKWFSPMPPPPK